MSENFEELHGGVDASMPNELERRLKAAEETLWKIKEDFGCNKHLCEGCMACLARSYFDKWNPAKIL